MAVASPVAWISPSSAHENLGLLNRNELAALRERGTISDVDAGTVVAKAGSMATHVQIVTAGGLELMARLASGRATMAVVRPGGVILDIPMLLGKPMPFDAIASTDSGLPEPHDHRPPARRPPAVGDAGVRRAAGPRGRVHPLRRHPH